MKLIKYAMLMLLASTLVEPLYAIEKNVSGQKVTFFVFTAATSTPRTGDAANLTAYVSKDDGTVTALTDTSATESDVTKAPGYYVFDLTQAETNATKLAFSATSSTSGVTVMGAPPVAYTTPPNFALAVISSGGVIDSNLLRVNGSTTLDGKTPQELLVLLQAALAGSITGGQSSPVAVSPTGETRISASVDGSGNRTTTLNVTNPN